MSYVFGSQSDRHVPRSANFYGVTKRAFDIVACLICLPVFAVLCLVILMANPFWNPGSLFYTQTRRGKNGAAFKIIKFRSMSPAKGETRSADDPLEVHRVTPLGHLLRRSQMDELPQIFNVLLGEMSFIGPRPEIEEFAETYATIIPDYTVRESVRPGITGYAQVTQGYTDSIAMIHRKTELDTYYVYNMGWALDIRILVRTVFVVYGFVRR